MTTPLILDPEKAALVVVDVQERLLPSMHEGEAMIENCRRLIRGCRDLEVPVIVTEQYPKGLGHTAPMLLEEAGDSPVLEKRTFSCWGGPDFPASIQGRFQIILCGIEAHVCVNQTAHDLLAAGHEVHLVRDAVTSRVATNREAGVAKMERAGAVPSSTEMVLFELMRTSEHPQFRDISKIIR